MEKIIVQKAIDDVLDSINKEHENYNEASSRDEIFEIKKVIRIRIKELHAKLEGLNKELKELEK